MSIQPTNSESGRDQHLLHLVAELGDRNGMIRRHAREALEQVGKATTPYLVEKLRSPIADVRWEATKALGRIADPKAAPALVGMLMDQSFEIQWLAAEALIALGSAAVRPLLEGLIHNYGSVYMRQGAHHVLHDLERRHLLTPPTLLVLDDLRSIQSLEPYPVSARRALKDLPAITGDMPSGNIN